MPKPPVTKEDKPQAKFPLMLCTLRSDAEMTLDHFATVLGYSPQYIHDLEAGRRLPSVKVVNAICDYTGRGPIGRREWHIAGAVAHGWDVDD